MNSKRFIMVKVSAALFKNIFGDRNVADLCEFNFPSSFYDQFLCFESVNMLLFF